MKKAKTYVTVISEYLANPSVRWIILMIALIAIVGITGNTFEERCALNFPDDIRQQQKCVVSLRDAQHPR